MLKFSVVILEVASANFASMQCIYFALNFGKTVLEIDKKMTRKRAEAPV